MSIYVEILIRSDIDTLWEHTQTPDVHARWDLRFSSIEYLPRPDPALPQAFLYSTGIGFGAVIHGEGETAGSRADEKGCRTSALKFRSDDPRSLIREGSGYWQYEPVPKGVRFLTQYNYRTRYGLAGRWFDRIVFRPVLGWATAWSFDRLRLWLEKGINPERALERSVIHGIVRTTLAFIWIYQGLVPKLLYRDTGEAAILQHSHLFHGYEGTVLSLVGVAEIVFGVLFLWRWHSRLFLSLNILLLVVLGLGAAVSQPRMFIAPFNPITLSLAMSALSIIGLVVAHDLPSARTCSRKRKDPSK